MTDEFSPTLDEVLPQVIRREVDRLHFGMPAEVLSYDAERRSASVQPLGRRTLRDGRVVTLPVIERAPVCFPQFGDYEIVAPLTAGQTVWLSFGERSLERWLTDGGQYTVDDVRRCHLSDAVVMPGLYPYAGGAQPHTAEHLTIGRRDGAALVTITQDEVRLGEASASDPVVRRSDLQAALDDVWATYGAHTHTAPGGSTGTPTTITPAPGSQWPASGSNKVKSS